MQECLLLVFEFERNEESRSFNQVVPVVLSSTLNYSLVIFKLVSLQNVSSNIIFKGIVIDALLLALGVILDWTHPVWCHWTFFDWSESFKTVLYVLVIILVIPVVKSTISLSLSILRSVVLTLSSRALTVLRFLRLILANKLSALTNQLALLHSSLLHSKDFFKTNTFHVSLHRAEDEVTSTCLQCLVSLFTDQDLAGWALWAHSRSLVDRGSNEWELGLGLSDDASNDLTGMDSHLYAKLLGVSQCLRVDIALHTASEVRDTHWMVRAEKSIINVFFDDFKSTTCHVSLSYGLNLLQSVLFAEWVESVVDSI